MNIIQKILKQKNYSSLIIHVYPKNLLLNNKNYYYTFDNYIQIIKNGNIEPNIRPINRLLRNHLLIHMKRSKLYFIPNTIKLKLKHISIETKYEPFLNSNHPNHQAIQQTHGYLYRSIQNHPNIHRRRLLYALVITQSPLPHECNLLLFDLGTYIQNSKHTKNLKTKQNNKNN